MRFIQASWSRQGFPVWLLFQISILALGAYWLLSRPPVLLQAGLSAPDGAEARVTVSDVRLADGTAPLTLSRLIFRNTNQQGVAVQNRWDNVAPGTPSEWVALEKLPPKIWGTLRVLAVVRGKDVASMKVKVEVRVPEGTPLVVEETTKGGTLTLVRRLSSERKWELLSPTQIYKKSLEQARAVAVPPQDRPRRFVIADSVYGPGAVPEALSDAIAIFSYLGINTAQFTGWGSASSALEDEATQAGISRFRAAVFKPPSYFAWNLTPDVRDPNEWATEMATQARNNGVNPQKMALIHIADEPGWWFPDAFTNAAKDPIRQQLFRNYLQEQGLTPADVGAASWDTVQPIGASSARDLPTRRLFYWSVRYLSDGAVRGLHEWTIALRRQFGPQLRTTSNWNNHVSRIYRPMPYRKTPKTDVPSPDAALGSMDWMETGRRRAVSLLWSEDWFSDSQAQHWSFYADVLRCAAREGNDSPAPAVRAADFTNSDGLAPLEFGGYIVGRTLGTHPAAGRLRALALTGHGAKTLEYFCYGPEALFPGNCYSGNNAAFGAIADANRIIGRAEELLYPGRRQTARVAILLSASAQVWDAGPQLPMYQREIAALHFALTHSHFPVDFLDETAVAQGALKKYDYRVLFVTAPNVAAKAQSTLRDWIRGGGYAVFSPGAAAADEYNTPTDLLDEARGLRSVPLPRPLSGPQGDLDPDIPAGDGYGAVQKKPVVVTSKPILGAHRAEFETPVAPLVPLLEANEVATFGDGTPAALHKTFGTGQTTSLGFWPAQAYLNSAKVTARDRLPQGWNAALRDVICAPVRAASVTPPVTVNLPVIEASRLDSPQGSAIVLLNWTDTPQKQISVTIHDAARYTRVSSAQGIPVQSERDGQNLRVTLPLDYADVLLLKP
jgi:hypothetical protein